MVIRPRRATDRLLARVLYTGSSQACVQAALRDAIAWLDPALPLLGHDAGSARPG
jgi:hypothetical protein